MAAAKTRTIRPHPRHKPQRTPKPPKEKQPRKPRSDGFVAASEHRQQVEAMIGYGLTQEQVASLIVNPHTGHGITVETLQRHFAREIEVGVARADLAVVQALHRNAVGRAAEYDREGRKVREEVSPNVTAQIWWTKARMGWREAEPTDPNAGKTTANRNAARERLAHQLGVGDAAGGTAPGDRTTH